MKTVSLFPGLPRPLLFGHRGCSYAAPENTMQAIELCVMHRIPAVEIDIHLTLDGKLVLTHDFNIKRVSGIDAVIEKTTWDTLKQIDVGFWKGERFAGAAIPRLEEVFEAFGSRLFFDIELKQEPIKTTGLAEALWKTIIDYGMEKRSLISSFNPFAVRRFRSICRAAIPTAVIYCISDEVPKILHKGFGRHIAGSEILKPHFDQVYETDRTLRSYKKIAWTVDSVTEAEKLIGLGIEGIISNRPEMLKEAITAFQP